MKRKIKFRFWDNETKSFEYWDMSWGSNKLPVMTQFSDAINQFTGLHDKNGKEIYDKMILNNRWVVDIYKQYIYLCDILGEDITQVCIDYEKELEITGEYFTLQENQKRNIDKYLQQAKTEIDKKWSIVPIIHPKTVA